MRIAITGTTGLLGRNLLLEIIKQNIQNLNSLEIIILGKSTSLSNLKSRVKDIIADDGFEYIGIEFDLALLNQIISRLSFVEIDLAAESFSLSVSNLSIFTTKPIDIFFHIAALSNFNDSSDIIQSLNKINVNGTKQICCLIDRIKVNKFIYVSSVYHTGSKCDFIEPDYQNETNTFRNPYEKTKLEAEQIIKKHFDNSGIEYRIYRISTISGRLIEEKIGKTNKFDVFYGWGLFFLKLKLREVKTIDKLFESHLNTPIRILINSENTMNIIPADYGAKLLYNSCLEEIKAIHYNLVNETDLSTKEIISAILDNFKIEGCSFVNEEPVDKTTLESLYYRSVGKLFTPYIIDQRLIYKDDNLNYCKKKYNLVCPKMNIENFKLLLEYANSVYFGLKEQIIR